MLSYTSVGVRNIRNNLERLRKKCQEILLRLRFKQGSLQIKVVPPTGRQARNALDACSQVRHVPSIVFMLEMCHDQQRAGADKIPAAVL